MTFYIICGPQMIQNSAWVDFLLLSEILSKHRLQKVGYKKLGYKFKFRIKISLLATKSIYIFKSYSAICITCLRILQSSDEQNNRTRVCRPEWWRTNRCWQMSVDTYTDTRAARHPKCNSYRDTIACRSTWLGCPHAERRVEPLLFDGIIHIVFECPIIIWLPWWST